MIYIFLIILLCLDLLTKYYFHAHYQTIKVLPFLNFKLALNAGVAFSLFQKNTTFTILLPFFFLIFCIYIFIKEKEGIKNFSLGLIIIGGFSNLIERIIYGNVTDFIDFHIGNWHYPTFNLADVYITLGIILYIFSFLKKEEKAKKNEKSYSR